MNEYAVAAFIPICFGMLNLAMGADVNLSKYDFLELKMQYC